MKDNTCSNPIRAKVDHLDPIGQVDISRGAQFKIAGYDSLDACIFASFGFSNNLEVIPSLLNARYGWDTDIEILEELGRECLNLARGFNRQAGFTYADDRLPEWMTREPLQPPNAVFDVPEEDMDSIFD